MERAITVVRRVLVALVSAPIIAYQRYISPAFGPRCRYAPSCSAYALQAIRVHGPIKGLILGAWRLLRCNPWSHGGSRPRARRVGAGNQRPGSHPMTGQATTTGNGLPPWDWTRNMT